MVQLLCKEGLDGYGVDIIKRSIWTMYDSNVILKEETIDPSSYAVVNGTWIIGNHSDELSPWIPIIAANSGYDTK